MQGRVQLLLSLLLGCAFAACASASADSSAAPDSVQATELLPWALLPLPGVVDVVDGEPRGGLQVEALKLLQQQMSDIRPSYRVVSRRRLIVEMGEGYNLCAAPFFRDPDGEKVGYFVPFILSTPIQAVFRRDQRHRFKLVNGRLSLERTLANPTLRGALAAGRTYPPQIQGMLNQASREGRLQTVGGPVGGENLLLMIAAGRVDYGFEFATVTRQMSERPQIAGALMGVPLMEYHGLVQSGIYCTRGEWGKRMAQRLDASIRQLAANPESLWPLYRRWMPEETFESYAAELARAYRLRSRQPVQLR